MNQQQLLADLRGVHGFKTWMAAWVRVDSNGSSIVCYGPDEYILAVVDDIHDVPVVFAQATKQGM